MTKFVKMSLAAAVAVAGFNSTASAMENTSFSGKLYVEDIYKTSESAGTTTSSAGFDIDFDLTAKTKITDNLTGVVRVEADGELYDNDESSSVSYVSNTNQTSNVTSTTGTSGTNVNVDNAYFTYADMGASLKMGRQDIDTPTTDGELGEGVFVTYTMGGITVAGANYSTNEIAANDPIHAVAVLGTVGPVNFEAWNVVVAGTTGITNNTLVVGGTFGPVTAEVRHATTEYDAAGSKDGATSKVTVSTKAGNIGLTGLVITTDDDGAAFVTDASSANTVEFVNFTAKDFYDLTGYAAIVSIPVSDAGTLALKYGMADLKTSLTDTIEDDASEYVVQYSHSFAKSTTATLRYAGYSQTVDNVDTDKTHARVDVTYKF